MENTTGKTIGGYTLLRELGRGGMSTVYAARERSTGETVALKLLALPPSLSQQQQQDLIARFAREARAVATLSHPGIVAIRDVGEQDGIHFLAMECLDGQTLRERLARGSLTPAQALPVVRQVADALDAVHAQGVVHRDIKPTNVMLLPDGTAKLLDFGVARQADDTTITSTGAIVGSPAYMAPEQIRGEPGAPTTDLWALGVLLYEMLAGRPPFNGNSIPTVLYQVAHEAPAPVTGLATPVQRVLRRALDKNPQRRYPTARALADALQAALPAPRAAPVPRVPWPPRRLPWTWAWLSLPVLLGLGVVTLTHHHTSSIPSPPAVPPVTPAPPRHRTSPAPKRSAAVTRRRPGKQAAKAPGTHKAKRKAGHAPPKHRPRHDVFHRTYPMRRYRPRSRRRFVPRRYGVHFDPAASARLQRFIYSPQ